MGLDMYLVKKRKKDALNWEHTKDVAYWRKANAIHKWFIENCGDGIDNCEYKEVSKEKIEELKDLCQEVLDKIVMKKGKVSVGQQYNKETNSWEKMYEDGEYIENTDVCEELLPSCAGFFFGSTDYDEYYVEDVRSTKEICQDILNDFDFNEYDLYYISSW